MRPGGREAISKSEWGMRKAEEKSGLSDEVGGLRQGGGKKRGLSAEV